MSKIESETGIADVILRYAEAQQSSDMNMCVEAFAAKYCRKENDAAKAEDDTPPYRTDDLRPSMYPTLSSPMMEARILKGRVHYHIPFLFVHPYTNELGIRITHFDGTAGSGNFSSDIASGFVDGRKFLEFLHSGTTNRRDFAPIHELLKGLYAATVSDISQKKMPADFFDSTKALKVMSVLGFSASDSLINYCYEQVFQRPDMLTLLKQVGAPHNIGQKNFRSWIETAASSDPRAAKFADRVRLNVQKKVMEWVQQFREDLRKKFETSQLEAAEKKSAQLEAVERKVAQVRSDLGKRKLEIPQPEAVEKKTLEVRSDLGKQGFVAMKPPKPRTATEALRNCMPEVPPPTRNLPAAAPVVFSYEDKDFSSQADEAAPVPRKATETFANSMPGIQIPTPAPAPDTLRIPKKISETFMDPAPGTQIRTLVPARMAAETLTDPIPIIRTLVPVGMAAETLRIRTLIPAPVPAPFPNLVPDTSAPDTLKIPGQFSMKPVDSSSSSMDFSPLQTEKAESSRPEPKEISLFDLIMEQAELDAIKPSPAINISHRMDDFREPEAKKGDFAMAVVEFNSFVTTILQAKKSKTHAISPAEVSALTDCLFNDNGAPWYNPDASVRNSHELLNKDILNQLGLRDLFDSSVNGLHDFEQFMLQVYYWRKYLEVRGLRTEEVQAAFIAILRNLK